MSSNHDTLLEGFSVIPAVDLPALTLDKYHRLFINRAARRLLDVDSYDRLSIAYDKTAQEFALIKDGSKFSAKLSAELASSVFALDSRYYLHIKAMTRLNDVAPSDEPIKYVYERGASDGAIFIFRRQ